LLLINAALGSFLAGTASRIFAVSMPTIASSLNTTIVGISWAVTLSGLSLLLVGVAQVMVGFVLPFYLQDILHLSPTFMGLLFISAPVFTVTLSPVTGWVADKIGPRLPSTAGILFLVIAAFIGGFLHADRIGPRP
jgi:MFS family permease